jgi:hypothetical protein
MEMAAGYLTPKNLYGGPQWPHGAAKGLLVVPEDPMRVVVRMWLLPVRACDTARGLSLLVIILGVGVRLMRR